MRVALPRRLPGVLTLLAAPLLAITPLSAQLSAPLDSAVLERFQWRSVGPANFSGRVTDIEGIGSPSKTFFIAAASGGIWKTTNGGVTFRPVFDHERVISMGDLAIAPSDTMRSGRGPARRTPATPFRRAAGSTSPPTAGSPGP
jgi:hypothetical protein